MVRWIAGAMLVVVAALGFVAWKKYAPPPPAAESADASAMPPGGMPGEMPEGHPGAESAAAPDLGVHWDVPKSWSEGPPKSMRLATYVVKDAECAVFYFGPDQGGTVDENIDMWTSQFEGRPNPKRQVRTVAGIKITRVEIDGEQCLLAAGLVAVRFVAVGVHGRLNVVCGARCRWLAHVRRRADR